MGLRVAAISLTIAGLIAGCAQRPQLAPLPANPFGYLKRSAVCAAGPIAKTPEGLAVAMRARSDDGFCSVKLSQPEGGAYASFLLSTLPAHGDSFIYNYNNQTIVTYTASTAYAGPDSFTVRLVRGEGMPRTALKVDVSVDATGVPRPAPPPPAAAEAPVHPQHHHSIRHHAASASSNVPAARSDRS